MGGATAGARLGKSREEGEQLLNKFFTDFSGLKKAIDDSKEFLKTHGYVEDFLGRRRRLEDVNLNPYEAILKNKPEVDPNFNPFLLCTNRHIKNDATYIWNQILAGYVILSNVWHLTKDPTCEVKNEMANASFEHLKKVAGNPQIYFSQLFTPDKKASEWNQPNKQKILADMQELYNVITARTYKHKPIPASDALDELISSYKQHYGKAVPDNLPEDQMILFAWTGRIAQASRQCFNARIQGSAASLTKLAMIDIFNDEILNKCQTKLIIPVHDELLVECPEEYADIVEKRLPEIMIAAAKRGGDDVPQSCDPYNVTRWYADTAGAFMQEEFKKLEKGDSKKGIAPLSRDDALAKVIANHSEVPKEAIIKTIETGCDLDF